MTIFLGLGNSIFLDAMRNQKFSQGFTDLRRIDQIMMRNLQITIVLEHTGVFDCRDVSAVKFVEGSISVKGHGKFQCTVTTEVVKNDAVTILHGTDRFAVFCNNESRKILINSTGLSAKGLNSFKSRSELTAFSMNMKIPASFNHSPVSLITIHGDAHTAAAGSNLAVECIIVQFSQDIFQFLDIFRSTGRRYVTAIQQSMNSGMFDTFCLGFFQHGEKMADVGMNVSVR